MSELIAEARVLVTPDVTTFRPLLISELAAATKGVTVPVTVVPVAAGGAGAIASLAAAEKTLTSVQQERLGAETAVTAASGRRTKAAQLEAVAVRQLAVAEAGAVNATSAVAAAQINATAAQAALTAARRAEAALTRLDTAETAQNTVVTLQNAEALAADTQAALQNARAHQARAAALQQSSKGAAAAALSFFGLRGATLAAGGAFLAGAASIAAFAKALGATVKFETSLNVFRATTDATAADMERISATAKQLGADLTLPGVTAGSAAEALSQLSRAGLDVEDSIDGVRGTLQLATAAAIDNEQAVTLVANAINTFRLQGEDATRVADLFAAASKQSQGSIVDVGLAFQQSAAAAAQAGVSVEDTIALLTQLGRAGLRGSDAGTSLRVALLRLINPSKQAREALEGLNIAVRDQQGAIRPEVFSDITSQLSQFTKEQRDATLAMIFGQDAFRAAAILGRDGAVGLREMRDATQEAGVAAELAAARTQGLAGAWENLKNQGASLGLTIGQGVSKETEGFVEVVAGGIGNINSFIKLLGDSEDQAKTTGRAYLDLVLEAGKMNRALAGIVAQQKDGGESSADLREEVELLNEALEDQQSASLKARDGIEDYRSSLTAAALELERLKQAITPPEGFLPAAPVLPPLAELAPGTRLEGAATIAAARGELEELLRIQKIQRERAQKAFRESKGDSEELTRLFNDMRAAEAAVIVTQKQISAAQLAASKQAKADAQQALTAAQQEFLARQAYARARQQNLIALADQTRGTADDIRERRDLVALLGQQIAAIRQSVLTERQKQDAIVALVAATIQTTADTKSLRQAAAEQRSEQRIAAAELNFSAQELLAQLTESDRDNERVLRAQIKFFSNEARRLGTATEAGKRARNQALQFVVQLRQLLIARKQASDEMQQGTSVADLLRENARIFAQSAGNVIGGDQPFDSPAAFSSSLARFLTPVSGKPQIEVVAKRDTATSAIDRQIQKLIDALNLNTNALTGGGPSGGVGVDVQVRRDRALKSFYESTVARDRLDARRSGI